MVMLLQRYFNVVTLWYRHKNAVLTDSSCFSIGFVTAIMQVYTNMCLFGTSFCRKYLLQFLFQIFFPGIL